MNESRLAGKVGLFVAIGLLLVALLLLSFSKGFSLFAPTYELRLKASTVGGLRDRSAVLMSGVRVGDVVASDVAPDGQGVIIRLKIHRRYSIRDDARFVIDQIGFLGDQYVAIHPQKNAGKPLPPGAEVVCEEPFNLQEVVRSTSGLIQRVDQTVQVLNDAIQRLDRTVFHEQTLTNLTVTLSNFRLVSERAVTMVDGVNRLVQTNSPPISISVSNLVRFSEDLDKLASELQLTFSTNRADLTAAIRNMESTTRVLDGLVKDIEAGKGLAGSLVKDEQLKTNLFDMVENLAVLSSNLNKYGLLYKPKQPKKEPVSKPKYPGRSPFN